MQFGRERVWVEAGRLPLADASVSAINCHDVVENVRDDEEAIDELARVLQPGGRLVLRVPSNGPLAWLDSYNLYHYLVDVSGHGPRAPETEEIGWRRHYDLDDIATLLGRDRFRIVGARTVGIGIAETVNIALLAICRFLFAAERFYQRSARFRAGVRRLEDRLPASAVGTTLIVTAERLDSPIP